MKGRLLRQGYAFWKGVCSPRKTFTSSDTTEERDGMVWKSTYEHIHPREGTEAERRHGFVRLSASNWVDFANLQTQGQSQVKGLGSFCKRSTLLSDPTSRSPASVTPVAVVVAAVVRVWA